jgi:integrase
MLRGDLAAARKAWIESVDDPEEQERRTQSNFLRYQSSHDEIWDFHAFRHGFISAVVQSGASVKVAQELARHASPMLTIGRYAHARLQDLRGAVEALPIASAILADTSNGEAQHKAQQLRSDSVPDDATACSPLPGR